MRTRKKSSLVKMNVRRSFLEAGLKSLIWADLRSIFEEGKKVFSGGGAFEDVSREGESLIFCFLMSCGARARSEEFLSGDELEKQSTACFL